MTQVHYGLCGIGLFHIGSQDVATLPFNGPTIVASEMAALYLPETRDIEILDVCAGTGLVGEKVRCFKFAQSWLIVTYSGLNGDFIHSFIH